jgi:hypothetical protein
MKIITTRLCFWADACIITPNLILVNPKCKDDLALFEHEKAHAVQMAKTGTLVFWFKYWFDKEFRKDVEVACYKIQIASGADLKHCASLLASNYQLGISQEEAELLLSGEPTP